MSMMFYFPEDISHRLAALAQNNERNLRLAEALGANGRDINLIRAVIMGTLADIAISFGLYRQRADFMAILKGERFPVVTDYTFSGDDLKG